MSDTEIPDDIVEPVAPPRAPTLSRRNVLGGGVALAASGLTGGLLLRRPRTAQATGGRRKLTVSWNANAVCLSPVLLAKEYGIYEKNGLDVDLVTFAGSTDQLLEAISTGKADAGVGMIMRWIKPLEQGFDVKLIAGTHGGCARMVGSRRAGVTDDPRSLKGKIIGLSEVSGTGRNTFSILLKAHGLDPERDVTWRAFPQPLLGEAVRKGEAHAIADGDPILYLLQKQSDGDLVEVLSNLSEPWQNRVCCVVGMAGKFLRSDREAARALAVSLVTAASMCADNPVTAARVYAPYAKASVEDLVAVLKSQTHGRHPVGTDLRGDIALYARELRDVGVMRASTEPNDFANRIVDDVFV
jgi:NitT/TauT family transport system substrate-binding protein